MIPALAIDQEVCIFKTLDFSQSDHGSFGSYGNLCLDFVIILNKRFFLLLCFSVDFCRHSNKFNLNQLLATLALQRNFHYLFIFIVPSQIMGHNLLVNKIDAILKNISNYLLQCWARGWQYLQIDVNCYSLITRAWNEGRHEAS